MGEAQDTRQPIDPCRYRRAVPFGHRVLDLGTVKVAAGVRFFRAVLPLFSATLLVRHASTLPCFHSPRRFLGRRFWVLALAGFGILVSKGVVT